MNLITYIMSNQYITDPDAIAGVHAGSIRIDGKLVLLTDDIKVAAKRILFGLSSNPDLALVAGLGLSKKSASGQWRRLSVPDLRALVLDQFVLTRQQTGADGRVRLEILDAPPNNFWLPSILQGRWLDNQVQSWFPAIVQPKVNIVTRP